jgi:hypothetical protein
VNLALADYSFSDLSVRSYFSFLILKTSRVVSCSAIMSLEPVGVFNGDEVSFAQASELQQAVHHVCTKATFIFVFRFLF